MISARKERTSATVMRWEEGRMDVKISGLSGDVKQSVFSAWDILRY